MQLWRFWLIQGKNFENKYVYILIFSFPALVWCICLHYEGMIWRMQWFWINHQWIAGCVMGIYTRYDLLLIDMVGASLLHAKWFEIYAFIRNHVCSKSYAFAKYVLSSIFHTLRCVFNWVSLVLEVIYFVLSIPYLASFSVQVLLIVIDWGTKPGA